MITIISRNVDGVRVIHHFDSVEEMLDDWNSDDPSMGDNHILLVVWNNNIVFSSLGRKEKNYEDTIRTADVMDWFN